MQGEKDKYQVINAICLIMNDMEVDIRGVYVEVSKSPVEKSLWMSSGGAFHQQGRIVNEDESGVVFVMLSVDGALIDYRPFSDLGANGVFTYETEHAAIEAMCKLESDKAFGKVSYWEAEPFLHAHIIDKVVDAFAAARAYEDADKLDKKTTSPNRPPRSSRL